MSTVLVIGGTLFIGRALVRRLLARGDRVTLLHRGRSNPFEGQTGEIRCDRNDVAGIREALEGRRFDVVFDNVYDWARGTSAEQVEAAALACAEGLRRYVFVSSVAAYGSGEGVDEDAPLAGADHPDDYVRNKAEAERMLFRLHRERGFPAVTLRPPYIYGPDNPFYREAFFWDRLLADRPVIVPGNGSRLMQFVYVDDLARAAILAADNDAASGRAYNIAHESPISQNDFVRALAQAAGKTAKLAPTPRETLESLGGKVFKPPYYFAQYFDLPALTQDIGRARRELGFEPIAFGEGLGRAFEWYRKQTARPAADFSFDDRVLAAVER